MRPISPRTGAPEVMVAENQEEYMPLAVAHYIDQDGILIRVTRWTLTPEERQAVANGEDIYIGLLSSIQSPMTPLIVNCGPAEWMKLPDA